MHLSLQKKGKAYYTNIRGRIQSARVKYELHQNIKITSKPQKTDHVQRVGSRQLWLLVDTRGDESLSEADVCPQLMTDVALKLCKHVKTRAA